MERAEKQQELEALTETLKRSQLAVCADYRGLTVAKVTAVRKELRGLGAKAKVVKNTLARISVERIHKEQSPKEVEKFVKFLDGPTLLVCTDTDAVSSAKALAKFAKELEHFKIRGAWFDGKCITGEQVVELSKMPSREETLSMLLNLMNTPATQLVRVLNAPGTQLVQALEAYRAKIETGSAAA